MTQEEINALTAILNRTPLTAAEALWLRELLRRLAEQAQAEIKAGA